MSLPKFAALVSLAALNACNSESLNSDSGHAGHAGGAGSGGAAAVEAGPAPFSAARLVPLYEPTAGWSATALAFDPDREGELWVTLRQFPDERPCNSIETEQSGCAALVGQVALVKQATGTPEMTLRRDGNAWHFMRRPTSIAFGATGTLATCGEARTDNYQDEPIDYSGPVLWSSDQSVFGVKPKAGQNGTHLDMQHETPYCMGIAHESGNAYFTFNGKLGAIDRYDFGHPHVIGGDDHSDGELARFVEGELLRTPEVPSHLALDHAERMLYIADTGHHRVLRLDIDSGSVDGTVATLDVISVAVSMTGAVFEEVVPKGVLESPSGVAVTRDHLLVTDNASGKIHWFGRDGRSHGVFDTGLGVGALGGIALGNDGKIYVSDLLSGVAYRVDPA